MIQDFLELAETPFIKHDHRSWLLLGTGPSLEQYENCATIGFRVMAIHRANKVARAHVGIFIDYEPFLEVRDTIHAQILLFPWMPHIECAPRGKSLADLVEQDSVLASYAEEGCLFGYDLRTSNAKHFSSPQVRAWSSTAEASVDILGHLGCKEVFTIGIDGGRGHSRATESKGVSETTDYSGQFEHLEKLTTEHGIAMEAL